MADLTSYRVAAVQMDSVPGELETNRRHAVELAREAIRRQARLIVFPELCDLDMLVDARDLATPAPGPFTRPFEELAAEHGVHFVVGMARRAADGLYNSAVLIGPGGVLGAFDKVHLWAGHWDVGRDDWGEDPHRIEPNNYLPGKGFATFAVDGVVLGPMICYDGMFPETWTTYRLLGADLLVWPTNRGGYGDVSVPELARFFKLGVMAVNRYGQSNAWCRGDSQIVDARGRVLATATGGEAVLVADLDVEAGRRWRRSQVELRDRRPELYRRIAEPSPEAEVAPGTPSYRIAPQWARGGSQ